MHITVIPVEYRDRTTKTVFIFIFLYLIGAREAVVKWPNDVWWHGKKLSGMLVDTNGQGTAFVGVGINVNWVICLYPTLVIFSYFFTQIPSFIPI